MSSINYVIATYSGVKGVGGETHKYAEYLLQIHLRCLYEILLKKEDTGEVNYITQVTIVCPTPRGEEFPNYYQKEKWIKLFSKIKTNLVYMPYIGENKYYSYDQWLLAYKNFPEFDYYLIIEDDYTIYPECTEFDKVLLDIYKEKCPDNIGYLCSWAGVFDVHAFHAVISNGLISRQTFEKIGDPLQVFYDRADNFIDNAGQLKFSSVFMEKNIPLVDYTDRYCNPYWETGYQKLFEYPNSGTGDKKIIVPVQMFDDEYRFYSPSSYNNIIKNFSPLLKTMAFIQKPKRLVEFGILDGFSLMCFAKTVSSSCHIEAYDIFEDFKGNSANREKVKAQFAKYPNVKIEKGNYFEKVDDFEDNSIDFMHIDIANTGDVFSFAVENYMSKMTKEGIIVLEGGSIERDNVWWMTKYNKKSIRPVVKELSSVYNTLIIEDFPSLTIFTKKI
jgi:predicted O-methyltransferase YrrM